MTPELRAFLSSVSCSSKQTACEEGAAGTATRSWSVRSTHRWHLDLLWRLSGGGWGTACGTDALSRRMVSEMT